MSKVIYILADNRSGSTLLDQLLGAHSTITSLGEVHHLAAYALQDRRLYDPVHPLDCSCGRPIWDCSFWTAVTKSLNRDLGRLRLKPRFLHQQRAAGPAAKLLAMLPRRMINRNPQLYAHRLISRLFAAPELARDSFELFDAVLQVTNTSYLVDSSKSIYRFRALYDKAPERMVAIHLVRDYRATVYSKMKRGQKLRVAATEWANKISTTRRLTSGIPRGQMLRLRYEDLCRDPSKELQRICRFLDVEFEDTMLKRPCDDVHHLGGSPSKFDTSRRMIELDESYLEAFSAEQLMMLRLIVGDAAEECGYD